MLVALFSMHNDTNNCKCEKIVMTRENEAKPVRFRLSGQNDLTQEKMNALTELINQVYDQAESGMWRRLGTRTTVEEVQRLLKQKALVLAERDGMIVGLVKVSLLEGDVGEFGMLVAHPDHQGIGIGSGLVHTAEEWARALTCTTMRLELLTPRAWQHPKKELLKQWYRRMGYQPQFTEPFERRNPEKAAELATECDFTIWHKPLSPMKGTL